MKTIEITFSKDKSSWDLRVWVPGYGTGINGVYGTHYGKKHGWYPKDGYENFLLVWKAVAMMILLLDDVRHPMVTNKPPKTPYKSKYPGRRLGD